ncbi:UDP-N-acetylenolpyruvoylglucosamine reductase [Bifidobacterium saguini DSM 23967]|uniref:UDP-N-acetylenolpyruvoylglucosamine reductase n=3 Tax=Bifidobacterium TaxID=1678 RepID=A0A2N5IT14_9BIFI|nr:MULTISPECIES: UDP-N-acetylmuramate dehydrogenase [Bifidobacterium]KFI92644.1 UDP-N-acetylenolpyruvoylglucosamine reductase [Bifidobacterium saguini DSM 23967]PLS25102.1 UDP-N-acetylenolpyruvoylglucosamine reductase [Bifidobacterium imperatoris]QSY56769.1 UDP-N-acetylmuramate dehydrogenase [Bifidobacterium imperatoris]QTB91656.1 UDP-N-acetylmuramate dehydrogenase [Bifidobacterium saguini]
MTSFADITTMGVGGEIAHFIEPTTRVGLIEAVEDADSKGLPLVVIGGGSNMLIADEPFNGVVVRDARKLITVPDEAAPVEGQDRTVHVNAEAGANWDDFVAFTVEIGLEGVEGLSGIPGTVGASVVQNIGAYGQEVATSVESVEVWDRKTKTTRDLTSEDLHFGYRYSALKASMYQAPGVPANEFFPTPRYVVLSVTFALTHSEQGTVGYGQLAKALGVEVGDRMSTKDIREAVLNVRAAKGMLEDPTRYALPAMADAKRENNVLADLQRLSALNEAAHIEPTEDGLPAPDYNRHSCGSFFMNPILPADQAKNLPEDAPRFNATLPNGDPGIKTSAAWLIDHAGCHKGFAVASDAPASLSTQHTLALTNRGGARAKDIEQLAHTVQQRVREAFGIELVPEPVCVGVLNK